MRKNRQLILSILAVGMALCTAWARRIFLITPFLISRRNGSMNVCEYQPRRWITAALVSIALIALPAIVAINSHEGRHGSQIKFGK